MKKGIVVITGGSGLLGSAMVAHLMKSGIEVVNLDVSPAKHEFAQYVHCDITDTANVEETVERLIAEHGRIIGLVNNAYPRTKDWGTPFEDIPYESWQKNVDMQLNSYFLLSQKVLAHMRIQGCGSVVNVASIYGVVGNDQTLYEGTGIVPPAAYSAIKGGLINLTRHLAALYGRYGVRVNCVSPGGIFDQQNPDFVKAYEQRVPMRRMGTPEDIAPTVTFMLSDDSRYITGQNIVVDGGWTAI